MTSLLLPQLLTGENDSKQSDEFQARLLVTGLLLSGSRVKDKAKRREFTQLIHLLCVVHLLSEFACFSTLLLVQQF